MRIFTLGPSTLEPFEIGALLMAILAFPAAAEEEALRSACEALCADNIRLSCDAIPDSADALREMFPDYAAIDARESRRALRTFQRRLNDRMIASRMSLGFLEQGATKSPPRLPASMARLSINELSILVLDQSRESVAENVEKRAWRETLPIIHPAAAYQVIMRYSEDSEATFDGDLQNLDIHRRAVKIARIHERMVLADQRFGIASEKLIRLHWVE